MDETLLWTVHSSRNDRCQIKLQNSPTPHSRHSPPINNRVLVPLSGKTVLIKACLGNPALLLSAPHCLHCFVHTLLTPDVKQGSVFQCDYLNLEETFEVQLGSPSSELNLVMLQKWVITGSWEQLQPPLGWDKWQCGLSMAPTTVRALFLQIIWHQHH